MNILTGPNNCGKSTILDALRLLESAHRHASRRKPVQFHNKEDDGVPPGYGWQLPGSAIPISIENIHTNYGDEPVHCTFKFEGKRQLDLWFGKQTRPRMYIVSEGRLPVSTTAFKKQYPLNLSVVPTLGPLEREEDIVDPEYLERWAGGRRAPRLFRNYWYNYGDRFDTFAQLVQSTWPGIEILPPERPELLSKNLTMFCKEQGVDREVAWAGFGFQVWLQLLTHVLRIPDTDIIVVDEPEIYLHPDLHQKILTLLRDRASQVFLATHSVEIIGEAEPNEVVLVEPHRQAARRLNDYEGLQSAVELVGSRQNIQLRRLADARRVLFVEGKDKKLLSRFMSKLSLPDFGTLGVVVIPVGGFSSHSRVSNAQWAFDKVLGTSISVGVLLDRDYRSSEECKQITEQLADTVDFIHILEKKEIENYVLVPRAIHAAIEARLAARIEHGSLGAMPDIDIDELLEKSTTDLSVHVESQRIARLLEARANKQVDSAVIVAEEKQRFGELWSANEGRCSIAGGKEIISSLNRMLRDAYSVSITDVGIMQYMRLGEVPKEMANLCKRIVEFAA